MRTQRSQRPASYRIRGNGPTVVPVLGNGRWDEPSESQQSLSSWAEFLAEEPTQSAGRNSKPKPSSLSLFERTLGNEQEREKELVCAGCYTATQRGPSQTLRWPRRLPCMWAFLLSEPAPVFVFQTDARLHHHRKALMFGGVS